jgi:AcrR family transcriptional regulator
MARRNDHTKEDLRELILDSAEKIIVRNGYKHLTARRLAQKIGYTPGTIYTFFKNIDNLILTINANTLDLLFEQIKIAMCKSKCPEKQISNIAEVYQNYNRQEYHRWELLFEYQYKDSTCVPDWYQEKILKIFELIQKPIEQLSNTKNKSDSKSRIFWASLHGIMILAAKSKLDITKSKSTEELIQIFIKTFIKGIKDN